MLCEISYSTAHAFKSQPPIYDDDHDKKIKFFWVAVGGRKKSYSDGIAIVTFDKVACTPGMWHWKWEECLKAGRNAKLNFHPTQIFIRLAPSTPIERVGQLGDPYGLPDRDSIMDLPIVLPCKKSVEEGNFMQWRPWFLGCNDEMVVGAIRRKPNIPFVRDCLLNAKDIIWPERERSTLSLYQASILEDEEWAAAAAAAETKMY